VSLRVILTQSTLPLGISSFAENPEDLPQYLAPLLDHARSHIPPSVHHNTPLFLLATAGMRLLTSEQQMSILKASCEFLKFHSNFRIDEPSSAGPCGSSIRIITGEEEGLFGWLAVNYLMDGFTKYSEDRTTYGFLDMGGASTQIAFEPSPAERNNPRNNLIDVRLRLIGGDEIQHQVFVSTWLGYGTNQARERYVAQAINMHEEERQESMSADGEEVPDPCLPKELKLTEKPVHTGSSTSHTRLPHTLIGTGSFEQCLKNASPLLNKDAPCLEWPCLFNGVHVPPIDFSVSHFIGVSEYWYSAEHVFGLGGPYDFVQYERAASEFCQRDWNDILKQHRESQTSGRLGGDGELVEGGKVVGTGYWGQKVQMSRLQMQCFKAAWIVNILHNGLGMPRIVDPGGNSTTSGGIAVTKQAERKGLGRPTFQSADTVGDISISWTLGKMVLEASKEVPPLSATTAPITDPLDGFTHWIDYPFSFKPPFWNFGVIEDTLSDHLPSSLTRESLGFSLVRFTFHLAVLFTIFVMYCRVRYFLRAPFRRITRHILWCRTGTRIHTTAMEEGQGSAAGLYPTSPHTSSSFLSLRTMFRPIRRITSHLRYARPPPLAPPLSRGHTKSTAFTRVPPIRSFSFPLPHSPSTSPTMSSSVTLAAINASTTATSTQMGPASPRLGQFDEAGNVPSFFSTRSRNSSQMNLSSLVPRQPISRSNSTLHLPLDNDE
jgi:golgi apyrase